MLYIERRAERHAHARACGRHHTLCICHSSAVRSARSVLLPGLVLYESHCTVSRIVSGALCSSSTMILRKE